MSVPVSVIVGVFIEDGKVCTYRNVHTFGIEYESGDIIELPRNDKEATVVILGIHEDLGQAVAMAQQYFKRLCKWDGVSDLTSVKLFGHDMGPIDEAVSQIAMFETQGIEGPILTPENLFDLMETETEDSH